MTVMFVVTSPSQTACYLHCLLPCNIALHTQQHDPTLMPCRRRT